MTSKSGEPFEQADGGDYRECLKRLVNSDALEQPALGMTLIVIDKGKAALSNRQRVVFEKYLEGRFPRPSCDICGESVAWANAYSELDGYHYCASCQEVLDALPAQKLEVMRFANIPFLRGLTIR